MTAMFYLSLNSLTMSEKLVNLVNEGK